MKMWIIVIMINMVMVQGEGYIPTGPNCRGSPQLLCKRVGGVYEHLQGAIYSKVKTIRLVGSTDSIRVNASLFPALKNIQGKGARCQDIFPQGSAITVNKRLCPAPPTPLPTKNTAITLASNTILTSEKNLPPTTGFTITTSKTMTSEVPPTPLPTTNPPHTILTSVKNLSPTTAITFTTYMTSEVLTTSSPRKASSIGEISGIVTDVVAEFRDLIISLVSLMISTLTGAVIYRFRKVIASRWHRYRQAHHYTAPRQRAPIPPPVNTLRQLVASSPRRVSAILSNSSLNDPLTYEIVNASSPSLFNTVASRHQNSDPPAGLNSDSLNAIDNFLFGEHNPLRSLITTRLTQVDLDGTTSMKSIVSSQSSYASVLDYDECGSTTSSHAPIQDQTTVVMHSTPNDNTVTDSPASLSNDMSHNTACATQEQDPTSSSLSPITHCPGPQVVSCAAYTPSNQPILLRRSKRPSIPPERLVM